jgi:hypothetical protein
MTIRSDTIANLALALMCVVVTYAVSDRFIFSKLSGSRTETTSGYQTALDSDARSGKVSRLSARS